MSTVSTWLRRTFDRPAGWWMWTGAGSLTHKCTPPGLPKGIPTGIVYHCECGGEWKWLPVITERRSAS